MTFDTVSISAAGKESNYIFALVDSRELCHRGKALFRYGLSEGVLIAVGKKDGTTGFTMGCIRSELHSISVGYAHL